MATATDPSPGRAARLVRMAAAVAVTVGAGVGGLVVSGHAAAGVETAPSGASGTTRPGAAYLAIAVAGNKRLDAEFDRLHGPDRGDVARADADLRAIAATEHLFDQRLASLTLPSGAAGWARALIVVNEERAALTRQAAASGSPGQLAGFQGRLTAANVPVERAVTRIRADLGLPAPDTG